MYNISIIIEHYLNTTIKCCNFLLLNNILTQQINELYRDPNVSSHLFMKSPNWGSILYYGSKKMLGWLLTLLYKRSDNLQVLVYKFSKYPFFFSYIVVIFTVPISIFTPTASYRHPVKVITVDTSYIYQYIILN